MFTLVKFENNICAGLNGENGTCMAATECSQRGGISSGVCASGYGVCCIGVLYFLSLIFLLSSFSFITNFSQSLRLFFHTELVTVSCGERTSNNNTYFVNPNYPSTFDGTLSCQLTLAKSHPSVCQFRYVTFISIIVICLIIPILKSRYLSVERHITWLTDVVSLFQIGFHAI